MNTQLVEGKPTLEKNAYGLFKPYKQKWGSKELFISLELTSSRVLLNYIISLLLRLYWAHLLQQAIIQKIHEIKNHETLNNV